MCVVIYDYNKKRQKELSDIIYKIYDEKNCDVDIRCFDRKDDVINLTGCEPVEMAFISMDDTKGDGYFLADRLKKANSQMNLIAMSDELRYGRELLQMHVSGYIIGARTREKVLDELDNLRY